MPTELRRPQQAFVARALSLCIGANAVRAAEIELLRAVKITARLLSRYLDKEIGGASELLYSCQICLELRIRPLVRLTQRPQDTAVLGIIVLPTVRFAL